MKSRRVLTVLSNLFLLWVLVHFGMGGLQNGWMLLIYYSPLSWLFLGGLLALLLVRSDYGSDLPLFAAGWLLGYWGEWWGTTRGVWAYLGGGTPPIYMPAMWGIGLLTVYRLAGLLAPPRVQPPSTWRRRWMLAGLLLLPVLTLARSLPLLLQVDWRGRLDLHFLAGILVAAVLIRYRYEVRQVFATYLCGMLLGGLYEYLGTTWGEWTYITGETPPWWIAPLWGLATVAMLHLAQAFSQGVQTAWRLSRRLAG